MTEDILVTRFREYIRINTMQPDPDYVAAAEFIRKYGEELGLEYSQCAPVEGKPCIVLTWKVWDWRQTAGKPRSFPFFYFPIPE